LPKWPFYIADALLVAMAIGILIMKGGEADVWTTFWCIFTVIVGAAAFLLPFIIEYKDRVKIEQLSLKSNNEESTEKLESLLRTLFNLGDTISKQAEKMDRSLLIYESLLRRMESRFSSAQSDQNDKPTDSLVHFEDENEDETDISLEMDDDFLDENGDNDAHEEDQNSKNEPNDEDTPTAEQGDISTITAYVQLGLGSKPYVRGEGGGLSWEKGIPMEYISVGKWQWSSQETETPIQFKIYKNDEIEAKGDTREVDPGDEIEISPEFEG